MRYSNMTGGDKLVDILLALLIISPVRAAIAKAMWSSLPRVPSAGEAQAIGSAPPKVPTRTLAEYYNCGAADPATGGFANGEQATEPDDSDGFDDRGPLDDEEGHLRADDRRVPSLRASR